MKNSGYSFSRTLYLSRIFRWLKLIAWHIRLEIFPTFWEIIVNTSESSVNDLILVTKLRLGLFFLIFKLFIHRVKNQFLQRERKLRCIWLKYSKYMDNWHRSKHSNCTKFFNLYHKNGIKRLVTLLQNIYAMIITSPITQLWGSFLEEMNTFSQSKCYTFNHIMS